MINSQAKTTDDYFREDLGADALIINYNKQALIELHLNNIDQSQSMFMKALSLLKFASDTSFVLLKSMTLNNLAGLCLKKNDFQTALSYLSEAEKSSVNGSKTNLAVTYINLSSFLSYSNLHQQALDPLKTACKLLKEAPNLTKNVITSLVVALHNLGDLYRCLGDQNECESYMRESWKLALQHFGPDHFLTQSVFKGLSGLPHSSYTHIKILKNSEIEKDVFKEEKKKDSSEGKKRNLASDFKGIRFLTGERLQPMHKTKVYRKIRTRPVSRAASTGSKTAKQKTIESTIDYNEIRGFVMPEEKSDGLKQKCLPLRALAEDSQEYLSSKASLGEARKLKIEEVRNKAARCIQRAVRSWKGRNERKRMIEKQLKAAKQIVAVFRGFVGKKVVKRKWEELAKITEEDEMTSDQAARKIQTAFRGFVCRKRFKKMKRSAIKIQSLVRMWLVRIIYKDIIKAVIMIQRAYRKYKKLS